MAAEKAEFGVGGVWLGGDGCVLGYEYFVCGCALIPPLFFGNIRCW